MYKYQTIILFFCYFFCSSFVISASEHKLDQDHFSGEYNPNAVYEYRTYQVTVLNRGEEPRQETRTDKNRKTIYYDNNLGNAFLAFIFTLIYFIPIGYIVYKRKIYKSQTIILFSILSIILVSTSFYSLTVNIKELYIRNTGIEVKGEASYHSEYRRVYHRSGSRDELYAVCEFSYLPKDSIRRQFSGRDTRLAVEDMDVYSSIDGTDVTICLSKTGEEAAIQLPRHQKENIVNIMIYLFILIIIALFYIGVFDKLLKKLEKRIEFRSRQYKA